MSEDSSYIKNDSDSDNQEGNDNVVLDSIMNKSPSSILNKAIADGLPTTEAPGKKGLWNLIADKKKIKDNIVYPNSDDYVSNTQHESDGFNNYDAPPVPNSPIHHQSPPNYPKNAPHNHIYSAPNHIDDGDDEDEEYEKLQWLMKLGELEQYGVTLSKHYDMNSSIKQMKREYELHKGIRDKANTVEWIETLFHKSKNHNPRPLLLPHC